jgi:Invasin, domain 3
MPKTAGGFGSQITLPFTGIVDLSTIAVDPSGDVFAVNDESQLLELPKTAGGFGTEITTSLSIVAQDIAFDSSGNLYLCQYGDPSNVDSEVAEMPKTVSGFGPLSVLPFTGVQQPSAIALDGAGDVFAAEVPDKSPFPSVGELPVSRAGVVSASTSTVVASPSTVTADGTTTSTVTVTLRDNAGSAVSGKAVGLVRDAGTHAVISAPSGASDANGKVTFSVKDSTAEPVTFTATDTTDGVDIAQTAQVTFTAPVRATSLYTPLTPARLLDTRKGTGAPEKAVAANGTVALTVDGQGGVPATGVTAVVLNVTVTSPTQSGYITVYGDGTSRPTASNLNYTAGETVPNLVVAPVGADGKVDLFNGSGGTTQLVADVSGYVTAAP